MNRRQKPRTALEAAPGAEAGGAPRRNRRVRPAPGERASQEVQAAPRVGLGARLRAFGPRMRNLGQRLRRAAELGLWGLLLAAVGIGALGLGRLVERHVRTSEAFAVVNLEVTGHVRLNRAQLLDIAGLEVNQNIFEVAPEEAEARLAEHPWIAHAQVRRRLPDSYDIEVRERRAVALLALDEVYLISDDGAVFKRVEDGDPIDLPVITGVERARFARDRSYRTSVVLEAVALLHDYRGAGLWRSQPLSEVHVQPNRGLSIYAGEASTLVRLGQAPYREKLGRLRTVLDELGQRGATATYVYLDNERRPDRVTVHVRQDPPAEESPSAG